MKLIIDADAGTLTYEDAGKAASVSLYSREAFDAISRQWVRVGWNQKYQYTFSWMGRPMIQLPEDMVRVQEAIYRIRPDVIIETGVAHGGSLIFYASLCQVMGKGRVIGVDIEIRPQNRAAIEAHALSERITLIEGDSIGAETASRVKNQVNAGETVFVVLDSSHRLQHVSMELECYAPLVTAGSYIVATDGIMADLYDVPRGNPEWKEDNPAAAARQFAAAHPEFVLENPPWVFCESDLRQNITHWLGGWLKRIR